MATYTDNGGSVNGSNKTFTYSFETIETTASNANSEVNVALNGVTQATNKYTVNTGPASITFNNTSVDSTVQESDGAPKTGVTVRVYRDTSLTTAQAVYAAGSSIRASDLNNNNEQVRFAIQEEKAQPIEAERIQDGTIITAKIKADNITSALIADDQIDSEHYVAGSIDLEHMSANSVDSDQYVDGSIDLIHMSANSVDSDQYVDGSIDLVHMSANSVDSDQYVDGSIDHVHLAADAVDGANIAANSVDSEHYVDGSIDHVHLANDSVDGDNIADDAIDSEHYTDGSIDLAHLASGSVDSTKMTAATVVTNSEQAAASANDTSFFTTSASDARYFNISSGDTIKDGVTFPDNDTTIATTAAINDRIVDLVDDVGGFVPIANELAFPNANPDVNDGAGTLVSIKALSTNYTSSGSGVISVSNGTVGNSTVTINGADNNTTYNSGFGMIVETTTVLNTYTFHRLVPKATEVTTVAGSISNVNTVAGSISNVNTTAGSIANVNTTAGAISNVNTTAGAISNVNTVASNISNVNNFAELYQIDDFSPSAPTTDGGGNSVAEGDLAYDSTANRLKVYTGSAWEDGVTAPSDLITKNTIDAKGDLLTGSADNTVIRTAVGSNGKFLKADSGASGGVSWDTVTQTDTTYSISCVDGDAADEEKIRLTAGGSGSGTDDVVLEAGTGLSIARDGDKITFTNTVSDTNTQLSNAEVRTAVEAATDSNVFTDADHSKLNAIEASATADQTAAEIRTLVESATDSNVFTDDDHSKLNAIEASATADQTGAEIKTAYEAESDTNAYTDAEKTKLAAIEASATADQTDAEIRAAVEAASDSNVFTDADHTKLNAIEASADVTDATNVDAAGAVMNSNLDGKGELLVGDGSGDPSALAVGTNGYILKADSSTATGLVWASAGAGGDVNQNAFSNIAVSGQDTVAADAATDTVTLVGGTNVTITTNASSDEVTITSTDTNTTYSVGDGGLTQNNFTNTLKTKLDGIEASATADQTGAEIKSAYEGESDTNAFTDALLSKLNAIEASATADQTNAEIRAAVEAATDSNVFTDADHTKLDGIEASATADQTGAEIKSAYEGEADTNAFTDADHTKLDGIATSANNYVHPNHSGEVTSTADGATVIADDTVDEANLKVDNSPTNDYVLTAKSSAAGGLTWAAAGASLASPSITGTTDVNYSEVVTHTITNWSEEVTYTFTPTACTIGSVNTSGQFTVTIAGSGSPSYSVVASTDALGLSNSTATQKTFSIKLTAPTLSSPADAEINTNVAYTITSTDANDDKLVLDFQSSNFSFVSTSHGSGSKVGNTVEVTGFTTNNPVVTVQITTAATYSVRAKSVKIDGSKPTSDWSSVDSIVIDNPPFSASGGTVTTSGGNTIHTFTADGDFVVSNQAGTGIKYLIIAGGGGGCQGGGGAGGLIYATSQTIGVGTHAVVVGAGGNGDNSPGSGKGGDGGNSSFNSQTAIGGGGGGSGGTDGGDGGSGGGNARDGGGDNGSGTSGQGNDGGHTTDGSWRGGGGGGGAGGAGNPGDGNGTQGGEQGGNGGAGSTYDISGSSVCYAGGGGGGTQGTGGYGGATCGGGRGYYPGGGTGGGEGGAMEGTDGTGGGGGGTHGSENFAGDGGNGIVIISYATP